MLNIVALNGHLTANPELRHTNNDIVVTSFLLAVLELNNRLLYLEEKRLNWIKLIIPIIVALIILFFGLRILTKEYPVKLGCVSVILLCTLQVFISFWNINRSKIKQFIAIEQSKQQVHLTKAEKSTWNIWLSKAHTDVKLNKEWSFYPNDVLNYKALR